MEHLNLYEAKTRFSHWIEVVEGGQSLVICKRNRPVALISPLPQHEKSKRQIGLAKGTFSTPATFLEPLPDDLIGLFSGSTE